MSNRVHDDITQTVGDTPLVRLRRLAEGIDAEVLAKLEFFNPGSSIKDRVAVSILDDAEASGALGPGGTVVEATSGNTGIGLAMAAAARGYRMILTMPEDMSLERRMLLKAFGAELVLTPAADYMSGAVAAAEELVAATPGAIMARQFSNPSGPAVHRATTAEEIWRDTDGAVDVFVAGIGTGGTITGTGQRLRELKPGVRIIGVEPANSPLLNGGEAAAHRMQGIGANFVPEILDRGIYDEVADVALDDALTTARALATREGILGGISAGAIVFAALEAARRPENSGATIVAMVPDSGERYLSTELYEHLRS